METMPLNEPPDYSSDEASGGFLSSFRERSPVAFWTAIALVGLGVVVCVIGAIVWLAGFYMGESGGGYTVGENLAFSMLCCMGPFAAIAVLLAAIGGLILLIGGTSQ